MCDNLHICAYRSQGVLLQNNNKCARCTVYEEQEINLTSDNNDASMLAPTLENVNETKEISPQEKSTNESLDFIKAHAENGVIINGFLLWVDIHRKTTPDNIWKDQAIKRFSKEEISDAKILLWKTCDQETVGKMVKRQGSSKTKSELNDISDAFKSISEKDSVPVVIGTSDMVALTPIYISHPTEGDPSEVNNRLKTIEESMNTMLETKLNQSQSEHDASDAESDNAENIPFTGGFDSDTDQEGFSVFHKKNNKRKDKKFNASWRNKLSSIRGTSKTDGGSLSADTHLVAYGVSKNVTGPQLSQFLERKGLHIINCELLTKFEGARSLAYKITVKSSDLKMAQNPSMWPEKVGVRLFQFFKSQDKGPKTPKSAMKPAGQNFQQNNPSHWNTTTLENNQDNRIATPPVNLHYTAPSTWTLPYPPPENLYPTRTSRTTLGAQGNTMRSVWFPENPVLDNNFLMN